MRGIIVLVNGRPDKRYPAELEAIAARLRARRTMPTAAQLAGGRTALLGAVGSDASLALAARGGFAPAARVSAAVAAPVRHLRARLTTLLMVLGLAGTVGGAAALGAGSTSSHGWAGGAATAQYRNGITGNNNSSSSAERGESTLSQPPLAPGNLPFTGLDAGLVVICGLGLLGAGLTVRRLSHTGA